MSVLRAVGAFLCVAAQACEENLSSEDLEKIKTRLAFLVQALDEGRPDVDDEILTDEEIDHIRSFYKLFASSMDGEAGLIVTPRKSN